MRTNPRYIEEWRSANPAEAVHDYLTFGYYVGLFPFRLKQCSLTGNYDLCSNRLQKLFSGILYFFLLIYEIVRVRLNLASANRSMRNEMKYFITARCIFYSMYYFTSVYWVWTSGRKLKAFMNCYHENFQYKLFRTSMFWSRRRKCMLAMCILILTIMFILLIQVGLESVSFSYNPTIVNVGSLYNFTDALMNVTIGFDLFDYYFDTSPLKSGAFVIYTTLLVYHTIFSSLIIFMMPIAAYPFTMTLKKQKLELSSASANHGLQIYKRLKELSLLTNRAFNLIFVIGIFLALPTIMYAVTQILRPYHWTSFGIYCLEISVPLGFLILVSYNANTAKTMFEEWLRKDDTSREMKIEELYLLLHGLQSGDLTFSACGFIQFGIGFLGAFVNLILTFAVIVIQFGRM